QNGAPRQALQCFLRLPGCSDIHHRTDEFLLARFGYLTIRPSDLSVRHKQTALILVILVPSRRAIELLPHSTIKGLDDVRNDPCGACARRCFVWAGRYHPARRRARICSYKSGHHESQRPDRELGRQANYSTCPEWRARSDAPCEKGDRDRARL